MSSRTKGRGCTGKKRYKAKAGALDQIARLELQFGAVPGEYRAYACQFCDSWHVGHRGTRDRKRTA